MKVELRKIDEISGLFMEEELSADDLDLNSSEITFILPVKISARIYKISNVVSVDIDVDSCFKSYCARCLKEIKLPLKHHLKLNYEVLPNQEFIELDQDIREELILNYPIRFLCKPDCKGLCPYCGKDLNEGRCNCNY